MATTKKISELTDAGALTGGERVLLLDGGTNATTTTQDIAGLVEAGTARVDLTRAEYDELVDDDELQDDVIYVITDEDPPGGGGGGGGAVDSVNGDTGAVTLDAADVGAIPTTAKGAASGVASLDADGKVPTSQLPPLATGEVFFVASQAAMLATGASPGDMAVRTDFDPDVTYLLGASPASSLANWVLITSPDSVTSVNSKTGSITLTPTDLGATAAGASVFTAANVAAIRSLLALGNSAQLDVGNTAFTVASGTDVRFTTVPKNTQTGTTYTLVLADAGKVVEMNNASANTLTIPLDAAVAFPTNTVIEVFQLGAGQTTISASGITLRALDGMRKIIGQSGSAFLRKRGTNDWALSGALTA